MASSSWEKRNARARKLGYRNYYDYRQHDYGKRPPKEKVQAADRAERTGRRGPAALRKLARDQGDKVLLIVEAPNRTDDKTGQYEQMAFIATMESGRIVEFRINLDDEHDLDYWHDLFEEYDIEFLEYGDAE